MRLNTDFPQWYDDFFNDHGPVFERMGFIAGGWSKRQQLAAFDRLGLKTPPHGLVRELARLPLAPYAGPPELWHHTVECVVYEDELAHRGEGKLRLPLSQALDSHPEHYATLYVPSTGPARNLRHARLGRIGVWIEQWAISGDWRSNTDADERILSVTRHPEPPEIPRVLWAIDFVPSPFGLLAVDFNTAPQLKVVGDAGVISTAEIHEELRHAERTAPSHLAQF